MIVYGVICSILPIIVSYLFAIYIGKKVESVEESGEGQEEVVESYEELVASYGKLPSGLASFAPIVVPILLMALSSGLAMANIRVDILVFLGTPIMAIGVGALLGFLLLVQQKKI